MSHKFCLVILLITLSTFEIRANINDVIFKQGTKIANEAQKVLQKLGSEDGVLYVADQITEALTTRQPQNKAVSNVESLLNDFLNSEKVDHRQREM